MAILMDCAFNKKSNQSFDISTEKKECNFIDAGWYDVNELRVYPFIDFIQNVVNMSFSTENMTSIEGVIYTTKEKHFRWNMIILMGHSS